jgi:hypothetical protein
LLYDGGRGKNGEMNAMGEYLVFKGASEAFLYINALTSFRSENPSVDCLSVLNSAKKSGYEHILKEHITDYQ